MNGDASADDAPELDLGYVRSRFPGTDTGWAFFDNAGGSLPLGAVVDRIAVYMRETPVQVGASYEQSRRAAERLEQAASELSDLVSGDSRVPPRQLVLGSSTTMLFTQLSLALEPTLKHGDEIIVTNADHAANLTPWRRLENRGVRIRTWRLRDGRTGLDTADLEALLGPQTRLVCFTHATNITGRIEPVEEITQLAHSHGAAVCVDGVALAPHRALQLKKWDVDFYAFSFYKVFGPHMAVLYGKERALLDLSVINHAFCPADRLPEKLQPGSFSYELAYASGAVAAYLKELGKQCGAGNGVGGAYDLIRRHESGLCDRLLDYLASKPGVTVIGPGREEAADRLPLVSFVVEGRPSASVPPAVDPHSVGIRYGHFYSPDLVKHVGLDPRDGVVRVSMAHYNTRDEVDRLIEALDGTL